MLYIYIYICSTYTCQCNLSKALHYHFGSCFELDKMSSGRPRVPGVPASGRRDRDEDLLLFKEMFKRERERTVSLLQPVSDEFEPSQGEVNLIYFDYYLFIY